MRERDVADLLDRAVETVTLPPGLATRVVARSRARRRRNLALSVGAFAVVLAAGVALLPLTRPAGTGGADRAGSSIDPALSGITGAGGRPVTADQVVASGRTGAETLVVVRRTARAEERALGGQAAEVWAVPDGGAPRRLSDYLSYDLGCAVGDEVCAAVRSAGDGLGLTVAHRSGGRLFVLVWAPAKRTVEVVAGGVPHQVGEASSGAVVEVVAEDPYEDVQVWATTTADGKRYRIVWAPGAVLND
ncbi:hypothetical protein [Micromonospora sp. NPDC049282]|uniref:hypothetical protein n=1 Tax=Micromonospora sp. NPDC049282 TaxID=3364269 RepID=UPI0037117E70